MHYFDRNKLNFTRWKSKYVERHLEDPSYVGFHIKFNFNESFENNFDDIVPGSLLYIDSFYSDDEWIDPKNPSALKSTSKYSALNYLQRLEAGNSTFVTDQKSKLLRGLIQELFYVQSKTPWFFQSLTGLDTAYKINHLGWRTNNEGRIEIETLESIDRRISFIVDAYRNVAWDNNSMTWLLPENLRKFGMEIIVAEFNTIQTKNGQYKLSNEAFGDIAKFLDNNFPGAYNTIKKIQARTESVKDIFASLGAGGNPADILAAMFVLDAFTDSTIQVFQLSGCEFDVLNDYTSPYLSSISMKDAPEAISNVLPIKFDRVKIRTTYSALDYFINDNWGAGNHNVMDTDAIKNSIYKGYEMFYTKDREELSDNYIIKRAKDIAKAIISGDMDIAARIRNTVSGQVSNIGNITKDLL